MFILNKQATFLLTTLLCISAVGGKVEAKDLTQNNTACGVISQLYDIQSTALKTAVVPQEEDEVQEETVEVVEPTYTDMETPNNNSFKSYMDAKFITSTSSAQYQLKSQYVIADNGLMTVDGCYVIAVGSYYTTEIGKRVDLVMENGSIVPCIVGDCKADKHTDYTNRQNPNGSIAEFIVSTTYLTRKAKQMGDCSYADERLEGEISYIRVYD